MRALAAISFFALASVVSQPVPAANVVAIGSGAFSVRIDTETGRLAEIESGGRTLLADDAAIPAPLAFDGADILSQDASPWRCEGVRELGDCMAEFAYSFGGWRGSMLWEVHPGDRMVRRSLAFEWTGDEPVRLHRIEMHHGKVPSSDGRGGYLLPGRFPPLRREVPEFMEGRVEDGAIYTPMAIGDDGVSSVMVATDELVPYSDFSVQRVLERNDGFSLTTRFETYGWMRKGVRQQVGDVWLVFRDGDAEEHLLHTGDWFRKAGMMPPADRPEWMESLALYSMHPCGRDEDKRSDPDGLALSRRYLPYLEALGVNCVWMRPVEDQSPYVPRDYFAFQPGVGDGDDLKAYVAAAHRLGIRVWRDAVVHGGRADSPRAMAHPEWLAWREDGHPDHVWTYDYSHPGWIAAFSNIVGALTREYALDGWRIDVAGGSRGPNWNPNAVSMRGSSARCQGGIAQQCAIRAATRAVSPDAATLAESMFASSACVSDAIYDFGPNLVWFFRFTDAETSECVRNIRRFLHEQQCAMPLGALLMHYEENHDALPAPLMFGRAAANALFAMTAWIRGIPLIAAEGEDGCFETWREILRIRREVPELTRGTCDYDSVSAPDGVFACLRECDDGASLVLVNFNGRRTRGIASYPGGEAEIDLGPFGYEVRRVRGTPLPPKSPVPPFHAVVDGTASGQQQEIAVTLRDGAPVSEDCRIVSESLPSGGMRYRVSNLGGLAATNVQLVVRMPGAVRWFACAADGDFESPFLVRHPGWDVTEYTLFHRPREGAVRWRSSLHPFGFSPNRACAGGIFADGSTVSVGGINQGNAEALVLDRVGAEPGLAVAIRSDDPASIECTVSTQREGCQKSQLSINDTNENLRVSVSPCEPNHVNPVNPVKENSALSAAPREDASFTGIPELTTVMAGWEWESGDLRVRIQRNGTLRCVWRRDENGEWRRILADASIETDTGIGRRAMFGGPGARDCKQSLEFDCPMAFWREPDGTVHLDFGPGDLRTYGKGAMMVSPIWFRTRYTLRPGADSFIMESAISVERAYASGEGTIALVTLDFEKRDGEGNWSSLGVPLAHVTGDVNRKVAAGDALKEIQWMARKDWPDQIITDSSVRARVTAWATNCPPDYMVLDLTSFDQFFYESPDALPYGLTNALYRTSMLVMRKIPAGGVTFLMGQPTNTATDVTCVGTFLPASATPHWVSLTNDYYMAIYETTQGQHVRLRGDNTRNSKTDDPEFPVDAMNYDGLRGTVSSGIDWPSTGEAVGGALATFRARTGIEFDIPTEAQWEFACRAGTLTAYSNGGEFTGAAAGTDSLDDIAWFSGNCPSGMGKQNNAYQGGLRVVGQKAPNPWGLYDMHGNVSEWCRDWAAPYDLSVQPAVAPGGPAADAGNGRIKRGGTWFTNGAFASSSARRATSLTDYSFDTSQGANNTWVWANGYRLVCPAVAK